jgi:hypothetical protein
MSKIQNPKGKGLSHLKLEFEIYLEFGVCDLEFRAARFQENWIPYRSAIAEIVA